jgi:hypothetical protein
VGQKALVERDFDDVFAFQVRDPDRAVDRGPADCAVALGDDRARLPALQQAFLVRAEQVSVSE